VRVAPALHAVTPSDAAAIAAAPGRNCLALSLDLTSCCGGMPVLALCSPGLELCEHNHVLLLLLGAGCNPTAPLPSAPASAAKPAWRSSTSRQCSCRTRTPPCATSWSRRSRRLCPWRTRTGAWWRRSCSSVSYWGSRPPPWRPRPLPQDQVRGHGLGGWPAPVLPLSLRAAGRW